MYNRQTLLDLRLVASDLTNTTYTGHKTLPPFLAGIPANLCRTLAPASRRKRFRRRGKRSGLLVKLKVYLVRSSPAPWNKRGSVPHHVFSPRSLEPIDAWLVPVDVPAAKDFPSSSSARCEPTEPAAAVSGLAVSHEHADLHQAKEEAQNAPGSEGEAEKSCRFSCRRRALCRPLKLEPPPSGPLPAPEAGAASAGPLPGPLKLEPPPPGPLPGPLKLEPPGPLPGPLKLEPPGPLPGPLKLEPPPPGPDPAKEWRTCYKKLPITCQNWQT
ncbi:skin secretory protein xP2-like [Oreochromis niloticus]|uniref:skin secretory protein xP2-like n=1 Tax=Oreochromis niloticus TaxID=8128 RepID=UPI000904E43C|nr:skin secretory protein xP2-like [Oreochromis niloticus]